MRKKLMLRGALGFPIGITIGYLITIVISFLWADGYYAPCVPELVSVMGSEIKAVAFQALLSGVVGVGFAASSVIWEVEHWGIAKQTAVYFLVVSVIMAPSAYVMYWMEHSLAGFLRYFGIFTLIFIVIWASQLLYYKRTVKRMNERLSETQEDTFV